MYLEAVLSDTLAQLPLQHTSTPLPTLSPPTLVDELAAGRDAEKKTTEKAGGHDAESIHGREGGNHDTATAVTPRSFEDIV